MADLTLPQQIARMDLDRLRAYRENLDFYNGVQWPGRARGRERRLTFNYAKVFVDKIISYLMSGLTLTVDPWEDSPQAREAARRAEDALHRIYHDNSLEQLDFDTELDCAILGDACFKVTWDVVRGRVRVTAPDVQGAFAWWQGDDPSQIWRLATRYTLTPEEASRYYGAYPQGSKREVGVVEAWTSSTFQLWVDEALVEEKPNPYGFIPFVLYPNYREPKQFWGVSDLLPLKEPARELNRALSQLSTILELSGNPIAVQPGAVWEVPEHARAYLLDLLQGGGVKLHVDYIDLVYRALHDLSEAPRTAFGDNRQGLSGVALEMELHPLLQKVRRKRLIRTAAYERRAEMMLRVWEQNAGPDLSGRVRVNWGPVLPQDRGRLVREEQILVEAGLHSRKRAMATLGVEDPEAEMGEVGRETGETGETR